MFKDKKFLTIFIVETIMPWIVGIIGMLASVYFMKADQFYRKGQIEEYQIARQQFKNFYDCASQAQMIINIILLVTGIIAFILMLVNIIKNNKEQKYVVARPLTLWLWSGACIIGTYILMFLTMAFSYGMGV